MKKLQILGPGCPKCRQLAANAEAAAEEKAHWARVDAAREAEERER